MATKIHPTAIIESGAQLGTNVEVGAYAYVGAQVSISDGTQVHHHATVEGNTSVGKDCQIFPYACIGGKTQDLKYKGGNPGVKIGDRTVFREFASVHAATADGHYTVVGSDNNFLAYTHIAHDCVVGNRVVMSNYAGLAGHVHIDDFVVIGGYGGVHQFCRVGIYAMVAACAKVVQDVPPYFIADGFPATARAINKVGLERAGFTPEQLNRVKLVHRLLYREGLNRSQAISQLESHEEGTTPEIARVLDFARRSERGLIAGR